VGLSATLLEKMEWAEKLTAANSRMILFIAFNYGGRQEIVEAVRGAAAAGVDVENLSEADIATRLYSPLMKDADLCIRTSGEKRLSNFLLWQSAYSELVFSDKLWPDWERDDFEAALKEYARRERRYGTRGGSEHA
jgi:undecaprenyl diphosphate synthase